MRKGVERSRSLPGCPMTNRSCIKHFNNKSLPHFYFIKGQDSGVLLKDRDIPNKDAAP